MDMHNDLTPIKAIIDNHRKAFPNHRRYPKKVWDKIMLLDTKYDPQTIAKELDINLNHLCKKIRALKKANKKDGPDFVPIPTSSPTKRITLTLPHNIKLSLEL